jgi:glucan phosphorylase
MNEKLQKHTFHFFEGDIKKLEELHPTISIASVVRNLVRQHILNMEKAVAAVNINKIKVKIDV